MKKLLVPAILLAALLPAVASAARRPNIVLVLMDDFGWGELGFRLSDPDDAVVAGVRIALNF